MGGGTGADGLCVNVGPPVSGLGMVPSNVEGRHGEDGGASGVAVCFDEYSKQCLLAFCLSDSFTR